MVRKKSKQIQANKLSKKLLEKAAKTMRDNKAEADAAEALGKKIHRYLDRLDLRPTDTLVFAFVRDIPDTKPKRAYTAKHCIGSPLAITGLIAHLLISFDRRRDSDSGEMEKAPLPEKVITVLATK